LTALCKLPQKVKRDVDFEKIPAAGRNRLIRDPPVISWPRDDRVAGRLPRAHGIDGQAALKLVKRSN